MTQTIKRDKACRQARLNPQAALKTAEEISSPWHRCQALAEVALYCDETQVRPIAEKALAASRKCPDAYQVVASAAWPIHALIRRNHRPAARRALAQAVQGAPAIDNPIRRADALFLVWQAALPLGQQATEPTLHLLVQACLASHGWKGSKLLRHVALILAASDPGAAAWLVERIPDPKTRRQAQAGLEAKAYESPRLFLQ